MREGPDIAELASLLGDPARARMLEALMSGLALTAGELAREAGVGAPTTSAHLGKLVEAGLLAVTAQGRRRYYRLADASVASALESLMGLASQVGRMRTRPGPKDAALRHARVCYDHLAGEKGVALFDALIASGRLVASSEGLSLTQEGRRFCEGEGLESPAITSRSRPLCRACLDWSERRPHLAGALGAVLLTQIFERRWARREAGSRAVVFSPQGVKAFDRWVEASRAAPTLSRASIY